MIRLQEATRRGDTVPASAMAPTVLYVRLLSPCHSLYVAWFEAVSASFMPSHGHFAGSSYFFKFSQHEPCKECDEDVSANFPVHTWVIVAVAGVIIIASFIRTEETTEDKIRKASGYTMDVAIQDRRFKNRVTSKIKLLFLCQSPGHA